MEQHPIPRQITSFEFKLIGFMTLHQFLYLVVFIPIAFIIFRIVPIPFLNFVLAALVVGAGLAFAFLPIQDRPLEVWIKNLWKRWNAPTMYTYHKENPPILILQNLYFVTDPHKVMAHVESREKLAAYLAKTKPVASNQKKQDIHTLLQKPTAQLSVKPAAKPAAPVAVQQQKTAPTSAQTAAAPVVKNDPVRTSSPLPAAMMPAGPGTPSVAAPVQTAPRPFMIGMVKNNKRIPLPGILVYVKDNQNKPLRLLKTNPHGVFATFHSLPPGDYVVEAKDPRQGYFFDTMKLKIENTEPKPIELNSKEML